MGRPCPRSFVLCFLAALLGLLAWLASRLPGDPDAALLLDEPGAEWIHLPATGSPHHNSTHTRLTRFRFETQFDSPPQRARLRIRALRAYELRVNGTVAAHSRAGDAAWTRAEEVDVAPLLRAGQNRIRVDVVNGRGPPALLVASPDLAVGTAAVWRARDPAAGEAVAEQGRNWQPVSPARERRGFPISQAFPSAWQGLARSAGLLLLCFALGCAAAWADRRGLLRWRGRPLDAPQLCWLIVLAWLVLCARNLLRLPLYLGMDSSSHYAYVDFLLEQGTLPLAPDGPQMFQPPLFYLLAAPLQWLFSRLLEGDLARLALRVLPMLAGMALAVLATRCAVVCFPERRDLRLTATVIGGLLPVNFYMALVVGNEPLAGLLIGCVVLGCFAMLRTPTAALEGGPAPSTTPPALNSTRALLLGALFGLALLTKVTALLLLPAVGLALLCASGRDTPDLARSARAALLFAAAALAVAGWYFLRNQLELGTPYVGGWDPSLAAAGGRDLGWQFPGYRVPEDLMRFGRSLQLPVYAASAGFWDALYSTLWLDGLLSGAALASAAPPWRFELACALALLSLPLAVAILWGALRNLFGRAPANAAALFSTLALATFLAAMLYVHLRVPTFSNAKASYTLGLLPCYALLAAEGARGLLRGPLSRTLGAGYLAAWSAAAWGSFV